MLFTILMPGQKPYAAKDNGDIIENISNLNFPYPLGVEHDYKEPLGKWDLIWRQFDSKLKEAFYSTFKNNNRVQVNEWKEILLRLATLNKNISFDTAEDFSSEKI